jgi:hypothetical protein
MHLLKHINLELYNTIIIHPIQNEPLKYICFAAIDTNILNQAEMLILANDRPGKQTVNGKC